MHPQINYIANYLILSIYLCLEIIPALFQQMIVLYLSDLTNQPKKITAQDLIIVKSCMELHQQEAFSLYQKIIMQDNRLMKQKTSINEFIYKSILI